MVCKARFQGTASSCSRWPFESFTLSGLTNPVRLHQVYPCISALTNAVVSIVLAGEGDEEGEGLCGFVCLFLSQPVCPSVGQLGR